MEGFSKVIYIEEFIPVERLCNLPFETKEL
jgi:hypothetical protein